MARYQETAQAALELVEKLRHVCTSAKEGGIRGEAAAGGIGGQSGGSESSTVAEGLASSWEHYHRARRAWLLARAFAFGPEIALPARLGANINFQPPRNDAVEQLLKSTAALPRPEETGAHLRGFSALEYVLFGARAMSLAHGEDKTCAFAQAVAEDLSNNATRLVHAWDPSGDGFLLSLTQPERDAMPFASLHEAMSEVVRRMGFVLENIRRDELERALGDGPNDADPEAVLSRLSARSLQDIEDQVSGVERLFFGFEPSPGLSEYANSRGHDFDAAFNRRTEAIRKALTAVGPSLPQAIVEHRAKVVALNDELLQLQVLIQVDITGALGLTPAFNDNDGD